VDAIYLYSESAEYLEIVIRFLDFQEIKEDPRKTQKPEIDRQVSEQPTQSTSQNALSLKSESVGKKRPWPGATLT
jgi:hypothetical protein